MKLKILIFCVIAVVCYRGNCSENYSMMNEDTILQKIEAIQIKHPLLLASLDCDLHELEKEIYTHCQECSPIVFEKLKEKSEYIQSQRSNIDKLLFSYAQKFSYLSEDFNKWIEKSLHFNRFYVPAVIMKLNYLQTYGNWQDLLYYCVEIMTTLNHNPEIIRRTQEIYNCYTNTLDSLNRIHLYNDAYQLYEIKTKITSQIPLFQKEKERERLALRKAHQGIFNSYYQVAYRSFFQKQYQLSEKYALLAYQYHNENAYFIDPTLDASDLLLKIISIYQKYIHLSDKEEAEYFQTKIKNIENKIGLEQEIAVLSHTKQTPVQELKPIRNVKEDTAKVINFALDKSRDEKISNDSVASPSFPFQPLQSEAIVEASTITTLPISKTKANFQQNKQYQNYLEQATYLSSIRQYSKAFEELTLAKKMEKTLDFTPKINNVYYQEIAHLCIEQYLNKAHYWLWNKNKAMADSIYQKALHIAFISNTRTSIEVEHLLNEYSQESKNIICTQHKNEIDIQNVLAQNKAQVGMYTEAKRLIQNALNLIAESQCSIDTTQLADLKNEYQRIASYYVLKEQANQYLQAKDSIAYINVYENAGKYHMQQGLDSLKIQHIPLIDKWIFEKNYGFILLMANYQITLLNYDFAIAMLNHLPSPLYKKEIKRSLKIIKKKKSISLTPQL